MAQHYTTYSGFYITWLCWTVSGHIYQFCRQNVLNQTGIQEKFKYDLQFKNYFGQCTH